MSPRTIIIQSGLSELVYRNNGQYLISYKLTEPLKFSEPHFARLLWMGGYNKNISLVFADFVERQEINGQLEPYLGCSAASSVPSWVKLASNNIPSIGFIQVKLANTGSIPDYQKFTFIIEIASQSWIHGTKSSD